LKPELIEPIFNPMPKKGYKQSAEVRARQSQRQKERWASGQMEAQRIGLSKATRKLSEEGKRRIAEANRKRGCPPETREKLRALKLGTKASEETIKKMRAAQLLRGPVSEVTRKKLSLANKGRPIQPSQRLRISETLRAANAENPEVKKKHWRAIVDADPCLQKGPQNRTAVDAVFKSPDNVIYKCRNITHFVREHPHLFQEEDVVWRYKNGHSCRAARGLIRLRGARYGAKESTRNTARLSWKGWVLLE